MINESDNVTVPYVLSSKTQEAYNKIKTLIKRQYQDKNLKEQFLGLYVDFAKKLKNDGYCEESYIYMSICVMYYHLIDRPDVLTDHEGFFNDLFDEFDKLLKCINCDDYCVIMDEFYLSWGNERLFLYFCCNSK